MTTDSTAQTPAGARHSDMTLRDAARFLEDEPAAERLFVESRWPDGLCCPKCGSLNVSEVRNRRPQPFHCRDCRRYFSVKTDSTIHGSQISLGKWVVAIFLNATNPKGIAATRIEEYLGVTYKTAWFVLHRVRTGWDEGDRVVFMGPVEVDETYLGGRERNKHRDKKAKDGNFMAGKTIVAGMKDRDTNRVRTRVVGSTDRETLGGFIAEFVSPEADVFTDGHAAYRDVPNHHHVDHGSGEYVRGRVHTNGIESLWSLLKRAYVGVYHLISDKHAPWYALEFAGRHNARPLGVRDKVKRVIRGMSGQRLTYRQLVSRRQFASLGA